MEIGKKQLAAILILILAINTIGIWLWQLHQTIVIPGTVLKKYAEVNKDSDHGGGIRLFFDEKYQQKVYVVYGYKGLIVTIYYFTENGGYLGESSGPIEI